MRRIDAQARSYFVGFVLSLIITILGYSVVSYHIQNEHMVFGHTFAKYSIFTLAIVQLVVQLYYFLNVKKSSLRSLRTAVLAFAALVIFTIVIGSMWIMKNLDYNMQERQSDESIIKDEGIRR